ncbi:MAG: hypothetical protein ACTSQF_14235 [Candidatus Heimdallarchaeaceae archaeon]
MDEERGIEDLEEEDYEDLDSMDEFQLEMEEVTDIEGLEEIPEGEEVGIAESDFIITYDDKIVDETEDLENNYNKLIEQVKEGEVLSVIDRASELLSVGKRLDAHYLTAKISSLIATLLSAEQKHSEATEYYLQAVSEARKSEDKNLHLLSLSAFGGNLKYFDFKDAAVVFSQARELATELDKNDYYAENSVELAHCLFETEKEQTYSLYEENISFFENISDFKTAALIRYRMGLINVIEEDYKQAVSNLQEAKKNALNIPDLAELDDIQTAVKYAKFQLKKGRANLHSLRLPNPEPLEETPGTKKIFEIYAGTGIVDIINRIEKKQLKLITSDIRKVNESEYICDENKITRLSDTDLLEYSKLYEEVGDIYLKENNTNSSFYNFLGSQLLALHIGNMKRAEKIEKKLEKTIQLLIEQEEDDTLLNDIMMYKYHQLASGIREKDQKLSSSYAAKGIEIASNRNNPYYEGVFREIIADVKSLKDANKAYTDYLIVISIYEELENEVSLMRIYEKIGNIFLFTQTDKAKGYLGEALKLAEELEDTDTKARLEGKL